MSRPTDANSEATYDAILAVALDILREEGPEACSLRSVARRAEVSTGTIQYYFENRAGLLEACLDHLYVWVAREVLAELECIGRTGDVLASLERITRKAFAYTRQNQELVRMRYVTTMERGSLPNQRLVRQLLPLLDKVGGQLAANPAMQARVRLAAHTLELAVSRYALHTDEECLRITGMTELPDALHAIEDHLVAHGKALFLGAIGLAPS